MYLRVEHIDIRIYPLSIVVIRRFSTVSLKENLV